MPIFHTKEGNKIVSVDQSVQSQQWLRLRRFGMALMTYVVVILAAFLITKLGLAEMSATLWGAFIGLCILGNIVFFILFYTNTNLRFSDPSLTREQIVYSALWGMLPLYAMAEARPFVLMFYLPPFSFGMLKLTRRKYLGLAAVVMSFYASLLVFEYIQYRQEFNLQYELFLYVIFGILLTWFAFFGGFVSNLRQRLQDRNKKIQMAHERIKIEVDNHKRTQKEKDNLIVELKDALREVKTLSGLLPICMHCKKIRDDRGYWNKLETYLYKHADAEFSHSICPDCEKNFYPEYSKK